MVDLIENLPSHWRDIDSSKSSTLDQSGFKRFKVSLNVDWLALMASPLRQIFSASSIAPVDQKTSPR